MPPLTVLIKPASGDCDLRCRYCFYRDETERRETKSFGRMTEATLENVVRRSLAYAEYSCSFCFQGGEPTLVGLDFFRSYIALTRKYAKQGVQISHAIQTNGMLLTAEWAEFFRENHFLVGLSLDGPEHIHNQGRVTASGNGSFDRVWQAKKLLEDHQVDFNILTVVTQQSAKHVEEIYRFFVDNDLLFQQYIPCLAPLDAEGKGAFALSAEEYGTFLCRLFDMWYTDMTSGKPVYIRYFENLAGMLMGYPPENCGMCGKCVNQYVVEADGSVYPCDFYVLDQYYLGNFNQNGIAAINRREQEVRFVSSSAAQEPECLNCDYYPLCRGGCRRDRQQADMATLGKSCYCRAYQTFFPYAIPRLVSLIQKLK